jgi:hypothetical protein
MLCLLSQIGTSIEPIAVTASYPLIVLIGSRGSISQHYLLLEGQATEVPSLLSAVDKAFKTHFLFSISYGNVAEHIWQFVQKVVYDIHDTSSTFAGVHDFQAYLKSTRFCIRREP